MKCNHIDCGNNDKIWLPHILPHIVRTHNNGLKSHSFCVRCGIVKNIGPDRAVSIGHFINVLSQIEKYLKCPGSNIRMRLVVQDLKRFEGFDDTYSMSKYNQEEIFINTFKKYYQISEGIIQQFL